MALDLCKHPPVINWKQYYNMNMLPKLANTIYVDPDDEGITLIIQRYYVTGFRWNPRGLTEKFRELQTIFHNSAYTSDLMSVNDKYLDAISKGNVKVCIDFIKNENVDPLYIKYEWSFGTAHALHYILHNLKYIAEKRSTQHAKYKELIQFIKEYLLPNMTKEYINEKYFRGGDVLQRGTKYTTIELIISVNDIHLLKMIMDQCKYMINFNEKSDFFGGMADGYKEWSLLGYCIENDIDKDIFEYLLTEKDISLDVNEYISNSDDCFDSTKYTILHEIVQNEKIDLFKSLMLNRDDVDINAQHESVHVEWKLICDKSVDERTTQTSLHIAIKNNNEYLVKLLIIHVFQRLSSD